SDRTAFAPGYGAATSRSTGAPADKHGLLRSPADGDSGNGPASPAQAPISTAVGNRDRGDRSKDQTNPADRGDQHGERLRAVRRRRDAGRGVASVLGLRDDGLSVDLQQSMMHIQAQIAIIILLALVIMLWMLYAWRGRPCTSHRASES